MSNLFKSKFLLGVMVVAALVVGANFVSKTETAEAASCSTFTRTLKSGSTGADVRCLQEMLNEKGFTVSASGAGAIGSETTYFGSKTKWAVMAFQTAMNLTSDGIFGPISRASLLASTSTSTNFPAGCTSTAGYSPTTGVKCDTPVSTGLPAGCTSTAGFSPINGAPCNGTTTTPVYPIGCSSYVGFSATTGQPCSATTTSGPVAASLATTNPASSTLVAGQATATLAQFTFTGSGTVTGVTLQRLGVSADSTPSNVYLFDGAVRLTDAASVASNGQVTFSIPGGIFTVNGSKTLSVRSDIAAGTSGQTVGMMLSSFTTSAGTVNANLSGNIHTIASATLAGVTAGTVTPTGAILNPGPSVTVWQSTLNISQRDVWMKRLALRNVGSAPASAFANFKLFVNGVQVATATGMDINGYVTFDTIANPVLLASGSRVVRVEADVVSGASRTVNFSLRSAADVDFVDSSFGVNIAPTSAPWGPAAASTISGTNGGTMTVEKDVSSAAAPLVVGANDASLGVFKFTAYGEPIKIENLRVAYTGSANIDDDDDALRNAKILINGVQYGSTASLNETTDGTLAYTQFTVNHTVNPGTPVLVEVRADVVNDGATAITAGDTIQAVIAIGASNAQRTDSLGSFNLPAVAVSANTLTVASTSVTVTENTTYADQSVAIPSTATKIGSWNLAGSPAEDVLVTGLTFEVDEVVGATFDFDDITNLYPVIKVGNTIVSQPAPLATVAATGNAFSTSYTLLKNTNAVVELYGNLASGATVTHSFSTGLLVTGTASVSGTAIAPAEVTGQTIAVGTASITATKDASTPVASIVHDNQTVTSGAFRFDAVTAGYAVTDLTFTLANATVATSVQLWDGATLVASRPGAATVTFNGINWQIPANTNKVLTVKLVLGSVGIGAGTSGASLLTTLTDFTASNMSTGVSAAGTEADPAGNAVVAYAAVPTVNRVALPTEILASGTKVLAKFDVVSNGGAIAWKEVMFDITKSAAPIITAVELWDVTNGGNTLVTAVETFQNETAANAACDAADTFCELLITVGTKADDNVEEQVSGTKTYEVRATISGVLAAANSINTSITSNLGTLASAIFDTRENDTTVNDATFVWSDMSAQSHDTGTADWVSEYLVKVLPTATWTMTYPN